MLKELASNELFIVVSGIASILGFLAGFFTCSKKDKIKKIFQFSIGSNNKQDAQIK